MNFTTLVRKSAFRNRFRTIMTIVGMAIAILSFSFLRTVVAVWNSGISAAAEDRLATRHRISITMLLPRTYYDRAKDQVPGIDAITYANWVGHINPADERNFFANFAVDAETYFDVYKDAGVSPEVMKAWMADPQGAVIGELLAKKYGWKVGDKVTLRGTIYPGDWTFNIAGFYQPKSKAFDKMSFFFHWKYLNEGLPEYRREKIGFFGIRVKDASQGTAVAKGIDKLFESSDAETLTESERAFNLSFIAMYGSVLTAMDIVSFVILLIMTMIVGNTIAMGVRERTREYGVLRAIGFRPKHLVGFVFGETGFIALLGGILGVAIAIPAVNGFGAVIEDSLGAFFPNFAMPPELGLVSLGLALLLGLVSAALPAMRVFRLEIISALRRVG